MREASSSELKELLDENDELKMLVAEMEKFKAQAAVEAQNMALMEHPHEETDKGGFEV